MTRNVNEADWMLARSTKRTRYMRNGNITVPIPATDGETPASMRASADSAWRQRWHDLQAEHRKYLSRFLPGAVR